jgi:metal-responsive CopG/Arc/MetJ family transcriptional regulator
MAVTKLSISIDTQLAAEVRELAGERGVSGFVEQAVRRELERRRLGALTDELDNDLGPVDEEVVSEIDALWGDR